MLLAGFAFTDLIGRIRCSLQNSGSGACEKEARSHGWEAGGDYGGAGGLAKMNSPSTWLSRSWFSRVSLRPCMASLRRAASSERFSSALGLILDAD